MLFCFTLGLLVLLRILLQIHQTFVLNVAATTAAALGHSRAPFVGMEFGVLVL